MFAFGAKDIAEAAAVDAAPWKEKIESAAKERGWHEESLHEGGSPVTSCGQAARFSRSREEWLDGLQ